MMIAPLTIVAQVNVSLQMMANGYSRPCEIVNAGDERLFVVEQDGRIRILYTNGTKETEPFLNITGRVDAVGGEKGLLGLAFPPDYCTSGQFYVNYTNTTNSQLRTRISRFQVNPDNPNLADSDSEEILLEFNQDFGNHNGGQVEFGPDGLLYIATGDGGSGGDPNNRAQNRNSYLGKLLRIDVSTDPYTIPADNPFVGELNMKEEIWAYGLRNPWKFAFDDLTGELYIGDVGQDEREEISYAPAGEGAGFNYGWRCFEGNLSFNQSQCANVGETVDPIFDFGHASQGNGARCSVTGGRVYRGTSFPNLVGKYIFTDFCSGEYWTTSNDNGVFTTVLGGPLAGNVVAFGADVWGELYAVRSSGGSVSRVLETSGTLQTQIYSSNFNSLQTNLAGETYIWTLDGQIIEGADGPIIAPEVNGEYGLTVISAAGCEITSQPFVYTTLGLVDLSRVKRFKAFPNPAQDQVNIQIELANNSTRFDMHFYTMEGKLVKSQRGVSTTSAPVRWNVADINRGIYLLVIQGEDGVVLARETIAIMR